VTEDHAPTGQAAPLPATRPPDPDVDRLARLGTWLAAAETGGDSAKVLGMAAALRLYYARELGLPPFAAAELSIVKGRLVVSAQLLRALARKAGYRVERFAESDDAVTARVMDGATELGRATFTMEEARRAGLVKERGAWATYPRRMLWARASTYAVRDVIPDVALGLYEASEIVDAEWTEGPPADPSGVGNAPGDPSADAAPYDPAVAPLDRTEEAEAEAAYREEVARKEAHRAHTRLALLIDRLEGEGIAPPSPHLTWTDFSRWVATDAYGVQSRSELDAAQIEVLIDNVEAAAGTPGV